MSSISIHNIEVVTFCQIKFDGLFEFELPVKHPGVPDGDEGNSRLGF